MNLERELRKPLFIVHGKAMTLNEAKSAAPITSLNASGSQGAIRASAAEIASEGLLKIATVGDADLRNLVVSRLQAEPSARFRFLDGREFSGTQAAEEVKKRTQEGDYFLRLEKRTMEIVLKELRAGKS